MLKKNKRTKKLNNMKRSGAMDKNRTVTETKRSAENNADFPTINKKKK